MKKKLLLSFVVLVLASGHDLYGAAAEGAAVKKYNAAFALNREACLQRVGAGEIIYPENSLEAQIANDKSLIAGALEWGNLDELKKFIPGIYSCDDTCNNGKPFLDVARYHLRKNKGNRREPKIEKCIRYLEIENHKREKGPSCLIC